MPPIESPSAGQAPATSRRAGRRKWLLAGIPILLVTVCVCLAVLRQLSEGAGVEPPAPVTTVSDQVPGAAPLVELAREAAAREPDNPELRLRLAEALVEAGQPGLAALEFSKAGNQLLERGEHIGAAAAYLRAVSLPGGEARVDPAVRERAEQAFFLGAVDGRIFPLLEEARAVAGDWPALQTIEARARLYAGDTEVAEVLTMEVLSREPEDALARAVQVEILMRAGTQDEARLLAQGTIRSGRALAG